jgi:primary-amine oxidase
LLKYEDVMMTNGSTADGSKANIFDPLDEDEIRRARELILAAHGDLVRPSFPWLVLEEPGRSGEMPAADGGDRRRRARASVLDRDTGRVLEVLVDLTRGEVERSREETQGQPPFLVDEYVVVERVAKEDAEFRAALARRGIEDLELVQIDPVMAGSHPENPGDQRIAWAIPYLWARPEGNGYAKPIEHVRVLVDILAESVIRVVDGAVVPIPPEDGELIAPSFRTDLEPLEITQPQGASFVVDGHEVSWQRWRLHVSLHPIEGLVLHDVRYGAGDEARPILQRAGLSEMVVPYGDPGDGFYWRNYFDAGEGGLGKNANTLTLGCDCLGEIHYFDALLADDEAEAQVLPNAICMHEEDYGILWKHYDWRTTDTEVRRSRRLVISSIATLGNYDYGFFWYLYQDGTIAHEVKLTGIVLTKAVPPGETDPHSPLVAPQLGAPVHQHLFNFRLDFTVDGPRNTVFEVDTVAAETGPDNPNGGAMITSATPIESEVESRRFLDPLKGRYWKVVNESVRNRLGQPVGYKLVPHAGPVLLADPESSVGRRAGFAAAHVWVTAADPEQIHAGGEFPNQNPGPMGLPHWVEADRPLRDAPIVVWATVGATHVPRPEDWPVMPVEYTGFTLKPVGFFDSNPALDVPPPAPSCHH